MTSKIVFNLHPFKRVLNRLTGFFEEALNFAFWFNVSSAPKLKLIFRFSCEIIHQQITLLALW